MSATVLCRGVVCVLLCTASIASAEPPPDPTNTKPSGAAPAPTTQPISSSLRVIVYPAKGQSTNQQTVDETECYNWAKTQTGIDPQAPPPAATVATEQEAPRGHRAKSAVRGAAAGAVIGEVANNDADEGAKVGAAAGVVAGGHRAREEKRAQQEHAKSSAEAAQTERETTFRKAFSTCMQGRGYTTG